MSKNQVHDQHSCDIVLLGLQSTGKSFLVKQLQIFVKGNDISKNHFDLIPSFGVNLDDINISIQKLGSILSSTLLNRDQAARYPKKMAPISIRIREVGGGMLLGWHKYTNDCRMVIYVVDMSSSYQLAASCIELLNLIHRMQREDKYILVLLNKVDAPCCFPLDDFLRATRWNDLINSDTLHNKSKLKLLTCSSYTGEGFEQLIVYLMKTLVPNCEGLFLDTIPKT